MLAFWDLRVQIYLVGIVFAGFVVGYAPLRLLSTDDSLYDFASFVASADKREHGIHDVGQNVVILHCFFQLLAVFQDGTGITFQSLCLNIIKALLSFGKFILLFGLS